ncbi:MAG: TerB family tellurite resistance protein [Alphaproteobacteria bacterium]|nr:TerB family tellurite resistance protein [Alphaproteobacteria bacterium]
MTIWQQIGEFVGSFSERTGLAGSLVNALDPDNWLPGGREAAFTIALIGLSAKMAVADGVVTATEVRAFHRLVDIPAGQEVQIDKLFELAQQDVAGFDAYARKIRRWFADTPDMLEHVLDGLFQIAAADGLIHEAELDYLKTVSDIFGFDEARFEQIVAQHLVGHGGYDPYMVLGLAPSAPDDEVKRVYHHLAREHHPDRLIAKGVPQEMITVVTARMAAVNAAYEEIQRLRRA